MGSGVLTSPLLVLNTGGSEVASDLNRLSPVTRVGDGGGGGIADFMGLSVNVNNKLEPLEETDESLMTPIAFHQQQQHSDNLLEQQRQPPHKKEKEEIKLVLPPTLFLNNSTVSDTKQENAATDLPDTTRSKPRVLNKSHSIKDDPDWIQVDEDSDEEQLQNGLPTLSPRFQRPRLPRVIASGDSFASGNDKTWMEESYRFTRSGTIWVDGFGNGIKTTGTVGAPAGASSSSASSQPFTIPMRDRLVFLQKLGQGASGIVYKALDLVTLTIVAVKTIPVFDKTKRRQMVHELGAMYEGLVARNSSEASEGEVQPSGIVSFYDAFSNVEDCTVGLIVEYMDGGSLEDIVTSGGITNESILANIAKQTLVGLQSLHDRNQIHRDLKPANILINNEGEVKISDFGIARNLDKEKDKNKTDGSAGELQAKTFVGTLTYMSPERIGGGDYGMKSDVWSLGLSLLTTSIGKIPINTKGGYWGVMACIRDEDPPSLPANDDNTTWSDDFRDFIGRMLRKDDKERPSCREMLTHPFLKKADVEASRRLSEPGMEGGAGRSGSGDGPEGEGGSVDAQIAELDAILKAVRVHAKAMVDRGVAFGRDPKTGIVSNEFADVFDSATGMLRALVLSPPAKVDNLAKQMGVGEEVVVGRILEIIRKEMNMEYLGDSD